MEERLRAKRAYLEWVDLRMMIGWANYCLNRRLYQKSGDVFSHRRAGFLW
jgi:hypothetical protein